MRQAAARAFMCTQLKFAEFNVIIHFYSCLFKENFFNTAYLHWKRKEKLENLKEAFLTQLSGELLYQLDSVKFRITDLIVCSVTNSNENTSVVLFEWLMR